MQAEIFKEINKILDQYIKNSERMLKKGFPWMVVLSFHEVYRYLYPTEPYIDKQISDDDKPQYILDLLNQQMKLYLLVEEGFSAYDNVFPEKLNDIHKEGGNIFIEESTHSLYGGLWENFSIEDIIIEPKQLLENRLNTPNFCLNDLKGKGIV